MCCSKLLQSCPTLYDPMDYSLLGLAQMVKNLPVMWETCIQSLHWEDPLEKGQVTHSSILAWRTPWTIHGVTKSQTQLRDFNTGSSVQGILQARILESVAMASSTGSSQPRDRTRVS